MTRAGKVLRIDPAMVNPQGAAGNGVAGVRLADVGDEVIAALPFTGVPVVTWVVTVTVR